MHIITRKHLAEAAKRYPDAAKEIAAWVVIVKSVKWHSFNDIRETFVDADHVGDFVVFNIRHNRYRIITRIRYAKRTKDKPPHSVGGHVFIRSVLTHRQYDNPANWE